MKRVREIRHRFICSSCKNRRVSASNDRSRNDDCNIWTHMCVLECENAGTRGYTLFCKMLTNRECESRSRLSQRGVTRRNRHFHTYANYSGFNVLSQQVIEVRYIPINFWIYRVLFTENVYCIVRRRARDVYARRDAQRCAACNALAMKFRARNVFPIPSFPVRAYPGVTLHFATCHAKFRFRTDRMAYRAHTGRAGENGCQILRAVKEPYAKHTFNYDSNCGRALYQRIFTSIAPFRTPVRQALIMSSVMVEH